MKLPYFALALLIPPPQAATSPFNGTWLMDIGSIRKESKPERFSVESGFFARGDVKSGLRVRADGAFHALPRDDYVDAVAVTIFSSRKVRERDRFNGKLVYVVEYTVSADGNAMTSNVTDFSKPDHKPIPGTTTYRRVGRAARIGSRLSGQWLATGLTTTREHLTERISLNGSRFSSSQASGWGFDAVIGGPPVPVRGDSADARTSVTMPDERTVVEHLFLHGVEGALVTMTVLPDDRTITVKARRHSDGADSSWILHKQ